jgi:mono/diheme cytochrome c family protein
LYIRVLENASAAFAVCCQLYRGIQMLQHSFVRHSLVVFTAAYVLALHAAAASAQDAKKPPVTAASVAAGKEIFGKYCSACHGPQGKGGPAPEGGKPARDLTNSSFQQSVTDEQLFGFVHDGVPPNYYMEAWGDRLSEVQIWNVVSFVRTLRATP